MKVIVKNLGVEYTDEGAGTQILMLHGWKDDAHTFDRIARTLANNHRVIRIDLPGFGGSDMSPTPWRLDDYVDFVSAFCEKLKLDVDILIGHSLGGRITIKGVARGILKPRKIVLIASAGIAKRTTIRNHALRAIAKLGKLLTAIWPLNLAQQKLRRRLYERIGSDYFAAGRLKETFINIIEEDLRSAASSITTPTLLIWGSNDAATPLKDGERMQRLIRGSRIEVIPGAGHFVHREHPEDVTAFIAGFI